MPISEETRAAIYNLIDRQPEGDILYFGELFSFIDTNPEPFFLKTERVLNIFSEYALTNIIEDTELTGILIRDTRNGIIYYSKIENAFRKMMYYKSLLPVPPPARVRRSFLGGASSLGIIAGTAMPRPTARPYPNRTGLSPDTAHFKRLSSGHSIFGALPPKLPIEDGSRVDAGAPYGPGGGGGGGGAVPSRGIRRPREGGAGETEGMPPRQKRRIDDAAEYRGEAAAQSRSEITEIRSSEEYVVSRSFRETGISEETRSRIQDLRDMSRSDSYIHKIDLITRREIDPINLTSDRIKEYLYPEDALILIEDPLRVKRILMSDSQQGIFYMIKIALALSEYYDIELYFRSLSNLYHRFSFLGVLAYLPYYATADREYNIAWLSSLKDVFLDRLYIAVRLCDTMVYPEDSSRERKTVVIMDYVERLATNYTKDREYFNFLITWIVLCPDDLVLYHAPPRRQHVSSYYFPLILPYDITPLIDILPLSWDGPNVRNWVCSFFSCEGLIVSLLTNLSLSDTLRNVEEEVNFIVSTIIGCTKEICKKLLVRLIFSNRLQYRNEITRLIIQIRTSQRYYDDPRNNAEGDEIRVLEGGRLVVCNPTTNHGILIYRPIDRTVRCDRFGNIDRSRIPGSILVGRR